MDTVEIRPAYLHGTITAPPSKSHAHRLLVAGALSGEPCRIENAGTSKDIEATADCLRKLGASVQREGGDLLVSPIGCPTEGTPLLDCGESGTTLRFMTPLAAVLCGDVRFCGGGRLGERPMRALLQTLAVQGKPASADRLPFSLSGRLRPGVFELPGNVSSQFVSGLLFALPLLDGDSEICLTTALSSSGYVAMTIDVLRQSGIVIEQTADGYRVPGGQRYAAPRRSRVEGDWSGASFFLAAGALGGPVTVSGLSPRSRHRDREIAALLQRFGAVVREDAGGCHVRHGSLRGIDADLDQIPDLALPLAAVAAFAKGETVFRHCGRLRFKESDRILAIRTVLKAFGIEAWSDGDDLHIMGGQPRGGVPEIFSDHRVAMMAAVIASCAEGKSTIPDPLCVAKSYPGFFGDYRKLGGMADGI